MEIDPKWNMDKDIAEIVKIKGAVVRVYTIDFGTFSKQKLSAALPIFVMGSHRPPIKRKCKA